MVSPARILLSLRSLRVRLLVLVALTVVPALALTLSTARAEFRRDKVETEENAMHIARLVSIQQDDAIDGARQLLTTLAQSPEVRNRDGAACSALMAELLTRSRGYSTFGAFDANGDQFCNAVPVATAVNVSDRPYVQAAIRTRDFALGEFTIGRASGKPVLPAAYPVLAQDGEVAGVVVTGLQSERLNQFIDQRQLPLGATVNVLDRAGILLSDYPGSSGSSGLIGTSFRETPLGQAVLLRHRGSVESPGLDGVSRLYGFVPLGRTSNAAYVLVGIPAEAAFAGVSREYKRNLIGLFAVALTTVGMAWFAGEMFIRRPVGALVGAAQRLAAGDLHARTGLTSGAGELGDLVHAFDQMAATIQARQTDAETAIDALHESEERLSRIIETMVSGLVQFDRDGRFILANAAAERIMGLSRAELLETTYTAPAWTRLTLDGKPLPNDDYPFVRVQQTGQPVHDVQYIIDKPSGGQTVLSIDAAPLTDAMGVFTGMVASFTDITERRRTEERLHATLDQLQLQVREAERARGESRAVLDAAGEAIVLVAPDGRLLSINGRFTELFGVSEDMIVGRRFGDVRAVVLRAFADPAAFFTRVAGTAVDAEARFTEILEQRWPQQRQLELCSTPVRGQGAEHIGRLYAFRDVTHEREVDRMKTEFVSMVSHELRTPLTSIKGYVDLLLDGEVGPLAPEQAEFLSIVRNNAGNLVALINDLLDISRIESGKVELHPATVDVAPLVRGVAGALRPQLAGKQQSLTLDLPEEPACVLGDAGRITQIITNLLSNAHKYTPIGGHVTVSVHAEDGHVRIDVCDTGVGLSPAEQAQIFTRFYRAHNRTTQDAGGTGLGLAITRSLVELHGGVITVASAPGEGSTFSVSLPATNDSAQAPTPRASKRPGGHVLVVEDEHDIANLISRYLTRAGYRVTITGTAADALRIARDEQPDLITLDMVLPDADGLSVLKRLTTDPVTADIPVLVVSMLADDGIGGMLGLAGRLTKPVQEGALLEQVARLIRPQKDTTRHERARGAA